MNKKNKKQIYAYEHRDEVKKVKRNEFHFYLQQRSKASVQKDKKKVIDRKKKYKDRYF